jgi:TolB-like protein
LQRASAHKIDKSIAVLPFASLSQDKSDAYFADGVQDQILTNLAKVSDLKVISHTSVRQYNTGGERSRWHWRMEAAHATRVDRATFRL